MAKPNNATGAPQSAHNATGDDGVQLIPADTPRTVAAPIPPTMDGGSPDRLIAEFDIGHGERVGATAGGAQRGADKGIGSIIRTMADSSRIAAAINAGLGSWRESDTLSPRQFNILIEARRQGLRPLVPKSDRWRS